MKNITRDLLDQLSEDALEQIKKHAEFSADTMLKYIRDMDGDDDEAFCAFTNLSKALHYVLNAKVKAER